MNNRISRAQVVSADVEDSNSRIAWEARIMKVRTLADNFRKTRDSAKQDLDLAVDFETDVLEQVPEFNLPIAKAFFSTVVKKIPEDE